MSDDFSDSGSAVLDDRLDDRLDNQLDKALENRRDDGLGDQLDSVLAAELGAESYTNLVELGRQLYDQALVRRENEAITDPRGNSIGWLLDTRTPMLTARSFRQVGCVLAGRLEARGVEQVAGFGFGSYALVCSVLAAPSAGDFKGGFIRQKRKPYGRRRLVEGPLDRTRPVVLLDDILNSGRSALNGVNLLRADGFTVEGVLTLFNFTWSGGRPRLEEEGMWVDALLDLNLREQPMH